MNPKNYKRLKLAGLASIVKDGSNFFLVKARFDPHLGTRGTDKRDRFNLAEVSLAITNLTAHLEDLQEIKTDAEVLL